MGAVAHGVSIFPEFFLFVSLCSFICLGAVYQLSGPVCKSTLRYTSFLHALRHGRMFQGSDEV